MSEALEHKVVASEHAYDRWREYGGRIYILDAFAQSTFIGHDFYESKEAEYYIWEDKIFVYARETRTIITVINVNYNLAPHINKAIIRKQTQLVLKLLEKADIARARADIKRIEQERKIEAMERQIKSYERKIEALRHIRNAAYETISRYEKEAEAVAKEHLAELSKLYYSVSYQVKKPKKKHKS